ncbi:hypothetical protein J2W22_001268 [Sphingomonas kyeonggiensis]|uniref:hypothetical protein n=1 Tax=Sphingomonas kyeonggiensis TaxID=1268553 RepID=UPI00278596F9|nr:hypothetical protein [Sphingomonas kyeonggiensis]MDQ0249221.1 hypothetical protein [Sphingomonas kyeonggiensis]
MISTYHIIALVLGLAAAVAAVEAEKLLLPPAGNPRIFTYFGLPNVAIWLAFGFLLGFIFNQLELKGGIRRVAVLEFVVVLIVYSRFRKTR